VESRVLHVVLCGRQFNLDHWLGRKNDNTIR